MLKACNELVKKRGDGPALEWGDKDIMAKFEDASRRNGLLKTMLDTARQHACVSQDELSRNQRPRMRRCMKAEAVRGVPPAPYGVGSAIDASSVNKEINRSVRQHWL